MLSNSSESDSIPFKTQLHFALRSLPLKYKWLVILLFIIGSITLFLTLWTVNNSFMIEVPTNGGAINEGIVGNPHLINPLLAISDADRDLTAIIYSGLMRQTPEGLIPDLADGYTISPDGLVYTFTLKDNLTFHDGEKLTTSDIEFTIRKALDPEIKSIKRVNWEGVVTTIIDDKTISFNLPKPYNGFLTQATIGILPKHLWAEIPSDVFYFNDLNTNPIGSGPYKIKKIGANAEVVDYYKLVSFKNFALGGPKITNLNFYFYPNENNLLRAYSEGKIDNISGISPNTANLLKRNGTRITTSPLPRVFGIFFNQNQKDLFTDINVRKALDHSIDKDYLVNNLLSGYGYVLDGPLPPTKTAEKEQDETKPAGARLEEALAMLNRAGWQKNENNLLEKTINGKKTLLEFDLATANTTDIKAIAESISNQWSKLGVKVNLKFLDIGTLQQNIIRPRRYDALFFGMVVGKNEDLYPFWHSSQRLDPGLNISAYVNLNVDKLLEEIRKTTDDTERQEKIKSVITEINNDSPAIFLYSPNFIYVISNKIKNFSMPNIEIPADRLSTIYDWHIQTSKVWEIFTPQENINN